MNASDKELQLFHQEWAEALAEVNYKAEDLALPATNQFFVSYRAANGQIFGRKQEKLLESDGFSNFKTHQPKKKKQGNDWRVFVAPIASGTLATALNSERNQGIETLITNISPIDWRPSDCRNPAGGPIDRPAPPAPLHSNQQRSRQNCQR